MIEITQKAMQRIQTLRGDYETRQGKKIVGVQLDVLGTTQPDYTLAFVEEGKLEPGHVSVDVEGISVFMAGRHSNFLSDVKIDFVSNLQQTGFKVNNPKVMEIKAPDSPPCVDTPEFHAVKRVLDTEINPGVASHGGVVTLLDVKDHIAYIRMGGGCHGCGSADVTLKQGVVVAIKRSVPEIIDVLDTTDHANGQNPYFASKR
jgi:Fe/S biogenesis protein NfuA